ncbi:hypothetical protein [Glycomyces terrestris]|uniref:Uncharacterized protein n=1 Tax=Glycomyces terrestris TaxID=2493553 RepID=A0A426UXT6_9ACTN|nr:hypothetical protein [Glycomyces terrestris]RRR99384.1 hypothetical protein EIW28_11760 [Glycomyces terrestris]
MSALEASAVEFVVVIGGIVLWLAGVFAVFYRGFAVPGVKLDELKFEVAERRGLFSQLPPDDLPRTQAELRERVVRNEVGALASSTGEERRFIIWEAWKGDPAFKAEVNQRMRDHYPPRHTYVALLLGGAWSAVFLIAAPLRDALVPDQVEALAAVWLLVAPLWIAFGALLVLEGLAAARRRSRRKTM